MRPPDSVMSACLRWLDLLKRNSVEQAWTLLSVDPRYTDLTRTQYHSAYGWLTDSGLLVPGPRGREVSEPLRSLPVSELGMAIMARALETDPPAWLADADTLIRGADDVPVDADLLGVALGLEPDGMLGAVQRAQRKVDAAALAAIGSAGELGLIAVLEAKWPGSTAHVASLDDTAGYDIALTIEDATWHLEVKATKRLGRLLAYLSRNEYDTGQSDPRWRLVVVGLRDDMSPGALATVRPEVIRERAPRDAHELAGWASARYDLTPDDLLPGLCLGVESPAALDPTEAGIFLWAPRPSTAEVAYRSHSW